MLSSRAVMNQKYEGGDPLTPDANRDRTPDVWSAAICVAERNHGAMLPATYAASIEGRPHLKM